MNNKINYKRLFGSLAIIIWLSSGLILQWNYYILGALIIFGPIILIFLGFAIYEWWGFVTDRDNLV